MKKEDLIEKYPELLKEIFVEFTNESFDKQITWNEYLEENKPKSDFKVLCINLPHHNQLWLSDKTNHFCGIDGKNVIEYEKGLLLGTVTSVKYKNTQYSIDDVVRYSDKLYIITSFEKERVHLKERNNNNYQNLHISNITKLKPLGVTEDGFDYYLNDPLQWIVNSSLTKNWEFLYQLRAWTTHPNLIKESNIYKIFHNEENALKFIEENNKKPLFISEDKIEIFLGDDYFELITPEFHNKICVWNILPYKTRDNIIYDQEGNRKNGRIWFSSVEKANEYKLKHAKVLSYDDVVNTVEFPYVYKQLLLNLVKERLNQK
jgi:hypothetical protein